jgi:putative transposase
MGDGRKVRLRLSKPEQQQLDDLLSSGLQPVRTVLRALVLRQLADGQAIRKVARNVGLTPKTVWLTSQRYQQGGLEGALYERARPGKEARLDAQQRQRIVAPGMQSAAGGPSAVDGALVGGGGGEAQAGAGSGTRDGPDPA